MATELQARAAEAAMKKKDSLVEDLVRWQFAVDPDTVRVYRLLAAEEDAEGEPVKLLKVTRAIQPVGEVAAFGFGPTNDFPYPQVIAVIAEEELDAVRSGELALPMGWSLDRAESFDAGSWATR
jgi:hypothetical protein